jgi:hypothetical protein
VAVEAAVVEVAAGAVAVAVATEVGVLVAGVPVTVAVEVAWLVAVLVAAEVAVASGVFVAVASWACETGLPGITSAARAITAPTDNAPIAARGLKSIRICPVLLDFWMCAGAGS